MNLSRLTFGLSLLLLIGPGAAARGQGEPGEGNVPPIAPGYPKLGENQGNEIIQHFTSGGKDQTAWKVQWGTRSGNGLFIKGAWYKRALNEDWLQVLGDARLAESFVPYNKGNPRYWDVKLNFPLAVASAADAGPFGRVVKDASNPNSKNSPTVVQEIRDRGPSWKDNLGVRRGQELTLWGTLAAGNYRYIIQYSFCDDGTICFRLGATGHLLTPARDGHMHLGIWRVHVALGGKGNNSVYSMEHEEPAGGNLKARTIHQVFNKGKEGWMDWDAKKFTMLRIKNEDIKNGQNLPTSYDLMPLRHGNSRHYGQGEEAFLHDFWVTINRPNQFRPEELPKLINVEETSRVRWSAWPAARPRSQRRRSPPPCRPPG